MAADGAGGVIVAWTDPVLGPQGAYGQAGYLRAMRFVAAGPVAGVPPLAMGGLSVKQARFNGGIIATVAWRGDREGTLEVFDIFGRRMASKPFAPSVRPVEQHVQGTEELGAGLYFIRARAGQFTATTRVLVVR